MTRTADQRRWWALVALGLGVLTLGFDITIMNVALPTIATELSAGTDALQWMVNAYVLVLAGLTLACGALGDRYGRKRLIMIGLVVFTAASAIAAWADSAGVVCRAPGFRDRRCQGTGVHPHRVNNLADVRKRIAASHSFDHGWP